MYSLLNDKSVAFEKLPSFERKKLIHTSRCEPENEGLHKLVMSGLWKAGNFKDLLELLPPIQEKDLQRCLRWRTQVLLRLACSSKAYVKRLIPVALSYCGYLGFDHQSALTGLVEKLVHSRNCKQLLKYFEILRALGEVSKRAVITSPRIFDPRYLVSPEIASRIDPLREEIYHLLQDAGLEQATYFAPGGHYLLLVECDYVADVQSRIRSNFSAEMNFEIDVLEAFQRGGKIGDQLKAHRSHIVESVRAQRILAVRMEKYFDDLISGTTPTSDKDKRKVSREMIAIVDSIAELARTRNTASNPSLTLIRLCFKYLLHGAEEERCKIAGLRSVFDEFNLLLETSRSMPLTFTQVVSQNHFSRATQLRDQVLDDLIFSCLTNLDESALACLAAEGPKQVVEKALKETASTVIEELSSDGNSLIAVGTGKVLLAVLSQLGGQKALCKKLEKAINKTLKQYA